MPRKSLADARLGLVGKNNHGSTMRIIAYNNNEDITVQFEQGNTVKTRWSNFNRGQVRNVYDKTVQEVGYIGEGKYVTSKDRKDLPQYSRWKGMLVRCYSKDQEKHYASYIGCKVDPSWHNYQKFAAWHEENYYEVEGEKMELDKDLLFSGNRVYSADKCIFVPNRINIHFTHNVTRSKDTPMGVHFDKERNKYLVSGRNEYSKSVFIGRYSNLEEAIQAYNLFKAKVILALANIYNGKVPDKVQQALLESSKAYQKGII